MDEKKLLHPVFIGGSAMTAFGEHFDKNLLDLLEEVAQKTLQKAQISAEKVEAIYISSMLGPFTENLQQLGSQINTFWPKMSGKCVPTFYCEAACASGSVAVHSAWKDVSAGHFERVLVLGGEKMSEFSPESVNKALMRATNYEEQASGITFAGLYALITEVYAQKYGLLPEKRALIPFLMHKNSQKNPLAQFQSDISCEMIQKSRIVASPLRLFDCAPFTDGAAGVILQKNPSEIAVLGSSLASDLPNLAGREEITSFSATKAAFLRLNLPQDWQERLFVLEVHDCFSISLLIALEDLQLAPKGRGITLIEAILDGKNQLLLNPSGGLKACGHPVGATGVKQLHSAVKALEKAPKGAFGLTQNLGGTGGTAVLHFLERY